jgi:hypothetical protein
MAQYMAWHGTGRKEREQNTNQQHWPPQCTPPLSCPNGNGNGNGRWETEYPEAWGDLMEMCDAAAARKVSQSMQSVSVGSQSVWAVRLVATHSDWPWLRSSSLECLLVVSRRPCHSKPNPTPPYPHRPTNRRWST